MKKLFIIPSLFFLSFFFFVGESSAKKISNKRAGVEALSAYSKAARSVVISSSFRDNFAEEGSCLKYITDAISLSDLDDQSKRAFLYLTVVFWSSDSLISLSFSQKEELARQASFLQRKSISIERRSKNYLGKRLGRSLSAHAFLARYYILAFQIDFCQLKEELVSLGSITREPLVEIYLDVSRERPGFNSFLENTFNFKDPAFKKATDAVLASEKTMRKLKIKGSYGLALSDYKIRQNLPSFVDIVS